MRVTFWGVRGSTPTPDEPQARYGGNTPCVSVELDDGTVIALDGGLGLRWMALDLLGDQFRRGEAVVHLLLSHFHWDHIQGIPFCPLMYVPGNQVIVYGRGGFGGGLKKTLLHQMDPSYCPVPNFFEQEQVGARLEFRDLRGPADFRVGSARVVSLEHPHGGWNTCSGFRIEDGGGVLAFVTDVEYPDEDPSACASVMEIARGADLLIHDAQFTPEEFQNRRGWGHSAHAHAAAAGRAAGAKSVALFHYDPQRTDKEMDEVAALYAGSVDPSVFCAREGQTIVL